MAMAAWVLQGLRRDHLVNKKKQLPTDLDSYFKIKTPEKHHSYFN
jgi:hypothetical protein